MDCFCKWLKGNFSPGRDSFAIPTEPSSQPAGHDVDFQDRFIDFIHFIEGSLLSTERQFREGTDKRCALYSHYRH